MNTSKAGPNAPTVAQIRDDLAAHLMPGTIVVPAGVAALTQRKKRALPLAGDHHLG